MYDLINKIRNNITKTGFYKTLPGRLSHYVKRLYHEKILFRVASKESVFDSIWRNNYWSDSESLSGPGSSLEYTKNIRMELPKLFDQFSIKNVFDAPCGDFKWMKEVVKNTQVDYIGGDIVKGIIQNNNAFRTDKINFVVFDITTDEFPKSDLWLCRDVFFHISNKDILNALGQFVKSQIPYLLTTTHKNFGHFSNKNIVSGDFRLIDLFAYPYNFPKDVLYRFDDYIDPHPPREMCLFSRQQIIEIMPSLSLSVKN